MGEIAGGPGPRSRGFFAGHDLDSQAATAPPPHGNHSKLQGHARRREKHGVCASVDRTAQILALSASRQRSTRRDYTSWPKVRGGLLAIALDLVPSLLTSRAARPIPAPPSAPREYRASLPVPTTPERAESSRPIARTALARECSFPQLQLPENPSWQSTRVRGRLGC